MRGSTKIVKRHGVIVILDALGIKGIWNGKYPEETTKIIDIWDSIVDSYRYFYNRDPHLISSVSLKAFSDTLIITAYSDKVDQTLVETGSEVVALILDSMLKGFFFRGCISVGDFYEGKNMILGPTIDEAAQYYDQSDWIGVFLTSSACKTFRNISEKRFQSIPTQNVIVKCDVPLKTGIEKNGYALNLNEYAKAHHSFKTHYDDIPETIDDILKFELNKTNDPSALLKIKNTMSFIQNYRHTPQNTSRVISHHSYENMWNRDEFEFFK